MFPSQQRPDSWRESAPAAAPQTPGQVPTSSHPVAGFTQPVAHSPGMPGTPGAHQPQAAPGTHQAPQYAAPVHPAQGTPQSTIPAPHSHVSHSHVSHAQAPTSGQVDGGSVHPTHSTHEAVPGYSPANPGVPTSSVPSHGVQSHGVPASDTTPAVPAAPPTVEEQLAAAEQENLRLKRQLRSGALQQIAGVSAAALKLRDELASAADHHGCLLISGPEGAGKSLAARVVHAASRRGYRSLVRVDCRVHTTETLRQTLFGSTIQPAGREEIDSAAFPRLHQPEELQQPVPGLLESCAGGTIVLDHVDSLSLPSQEDVCRAIQQTRAQSPGNPGAAIRVIATTRLTPAELQEGSQMRPELFNVLSETVVSVPSLASRPEDIGLLTEHFLNEAAIEQGVAMRPLTVDALNVLRQHHWPGNARELQLVIRNATTVDEGTVLTSAMLHSWISSAEEEDAAADVVPGLTLREMERRLIETTFARCGGNRERTARTLKIGLRTLSGKLREYGYPPRGGPGSNRGSRRRAA